MTKRNSPILSPSSIPEVAEQLKQAESLFVVATLPNKSFFCMAGYRSILLRELYSALLENPGARTLVHEALLMVEISQQNSMGEA